MRRLRPHLTYANVVASIAVFIALGGTSYAVVALPKNSVGAKQISSDAVGGSELRRSAVRSKDIKDRAVTMRDISLGARRSLRGPQGPVGPQGPPASSLTAAVNAAGNVTSSLGGAGGRHALPGIYEVIFNRDLRACYAVATLSRVAGAPPEDPQAGEIVTSTTVEGLIVRTSNSSGTAADLPFHVIVVC